MGQNRENNKGFRAGVGAFILNSEHDRVFVATRANDANYKNKKPEGGSEATEASAPEKSKAILQMPQGGIDKGETAEVALMREIEEETGMKEAQLTILAKSQMLRHYVFPPQIASRVYNGRYLGQSLQWFCLEYRGDNSEIRLDNHEHVEFTSWQWLPVSALVEHAIDFKRSMYASLVAEFAPVIRK